MTFADVCECCRDGYCRRHHLDTVLLVLHGPRCPSIEKFRLDVGLISEDLLLDLCLLLLLSFFKLLLVLLFFGFLVDECLQET